MANMFAKLDEVAHSGLVCIMFTSLLPYMYMSSAVKIRRTCRTIGHFLRCPTKNVRVLDKMSDRKFQ